MFEHMEVFAIASVIGCTKEELTSVPARFEAQEQAQKAQEATPPQTMALNAELSEALKEIRHMVSALGMTNPKQSQIAKIHEDMRDIAKMLHTDIRNLIETMDKYWKPQPPKYQVKDREER